MRFFDFFQWCILLIMGIVLIAAGIFGCFVMGAKRTGDVAVVLGAFGEVVIIIGLLLTCLGLYELITMFKNK